MTQVKADSNHQARTKRTTDPQRMTNKKEPDSRGRTWGRSWIEGKT